MAATSVPPRRFLFVVVPICAAGLAILVVAAVDDFKRINDRHGHPVGDRVLSEVAAKLRQGGEAFRLGGDEFALLLPGLDDSAGAITAQSVVDRVSASELDLVGRVTVSAGVATFPAQGAGRDELIRLADSALYWAKGHGKNRVRVFRPDLVELGSLEQLGPHADRAARYRAAAALAKAVDARDTYTGGHSERVGELAARIGLRLGLDREQIELVRAGRKPARPLQACSPGGDPAQAGGPHGLGAARARAPSADRPPDAREPRHRPGRRLGEIAPSSQTRTTR